MMRSGLRVEDGNADATRTAFPRCHPTDGGAEWYVTLKTRGGGAPSRLKQKGRESHEVSMQNAVARQS